MTAQEEPAVDVTVIAVSWNTAGALPAALHTLPAAAAPRTTQYVVVDNGSTDESVERLRALQDPPVEVVELDRNHGFTRGVNVGLERARGRYVLLCNPDVSAPPGAIDSLVRLLDERADAWAATPWFLDGDGSHQWFWRRLPGPARFPLAYLRWGKWVDRRLGGPVRRWRSYRDLDGPPPVPVEIDAVGAAFLLARRDDLLDAGGLDERFFNFFSDAALMRERRRSGRLLLGTGDVQVVHERGITFRGRPRWHRDAEFLHALARYVDGEPAHRRWAMRAALAIELGLPHRHRAERRRLARDGPQGLSRGRAPSG